MALAIVGFTGGGWGTATKAEANTKISVMGRWSAVAGTAASERSSALTAACAALLNAS